MKRDLPRVSRSTKSVVCPGTLLSQLWTVTSRNHLWEVLYCLPGSIGAVSEIYRDIEAIRTYISVKYLLVFFVFAFSGIYTGCTDCGETTAYNFPSYIQQYFHPILHFRLTKMPTLKIDTYAISFCSSVAHDFLRSLLFLARKDWVGRRNIYIPMINTHTHTHTPCLLS